MMSPEAVVYGVISSIGDEVYAVNVLELGHPWGRVASRSGQTRVWMGVNVISDDGEISPRPERRLDLVERVGARRPLDQNLIVREAVRFIDEFGRDRLTMRRLGARLGVEAMALYRYVPGREQLLDGVVEAVMDELYQSTMTGDYADSWQEFLEMMAHGVRDLALRHPKVFPLVATRPPAAPWLRPPLRSLRWVEGFLEGLGRHGFSSDDSVTAYRAFSTFLLGHLLLETGSADDDLTDSAAEDIEFYESNNLADYPILQQHTAQLSEDVYGDEFEDALEDLINRIEHGRG
jgi:AcrR family transcriptional regulator